MLEFTLAMLQVGFFIFCVLAFIISMIYLADWVEDNSEKPSAKFLSGVGKVIMFLSTIIIFANLFNKNK